MIFNIISKQTIKDIEIIADHPYYPIRVYTDDISISLSEKEAEELVAKLNQALIDLDLARKDNVPEI